MDYSDFGCLSVSCADNVLTVALDRPEKLNAVTRRMHAELAMAFERAALDDDAEVVVVTGNGAAFSAGGDFGFMQEIIDDPRIQEVEGALIAKRLLNAILDCPKPIIARLNGDAIGLGATIALFCDIIIAAQHAKIGDPHVSVGLVAGDGGAIIWPHLVGHVKAKEILLLGALLSATEAERLGLVNQVVPAEDLDQAVASITIRLKRGARMAIAGTKSAINAPLRQAVATWLDASLALEAITMRSDDHRGAVAALQAKTRPTFSGR